MTEVHRWGKAEKRGEGCWWLKISIAFWPSLKPKASPFYCHVPGQLKVFLYFLPVEKQMFFLKAVALIHFSIQILPAFPQPQNIATKTSDHPLQPSGFSQVTPNANRVLLFPLCLTLLSLSSVCITLSISLTFSLLPFCHSPHHFPFGNLSWQTFQPPKRLPNGLILWPQDDISKTQTCSSHSIAQNLHFKFLKAPLSPFMTFCVVSFIPEYSSYL